MSRKQKDKHIHENWLKPIITKFVNDLGQILTGGCVSMRSGHLEITDTVPKKHSLVVVMAVVETIDADDFTNSLHNFLQTGMTLKYGTNDGELTKPKLQ